jgi:hypothetical protein
LTIEPAAEETEFVEAGILVYEFARIAWVLECDEWIVDG